MEKVGLKHKITMLMILDRISQFIKSKKKKKVKWSDVCTKTWGRRIDMLEKIITNTRVDIIQEL